MSLSILFVLLLQRRVLKGGLDYFHFKLFVIRCIRFRLKWKQRRQILRDNKSPVHSDTRRVNIKCKCCQAKMTNIMQSLDKVSWSIMWTKLKLLSWCFKHFSHRVVFSKKLLVSRYCMLGFDSSSKMNKMNKKNVNIFNLRCWYQTELSASERKRYANASDGKITEHFELRLDEKAFFWGYWKIIL